MSLLGLEDDIEVVREPIDAWRQCNGKNLLVGIVYGIIICDSDFRVPFCFLLDRNSTMKIRANMHLHFNHTFFIQCTIFGCVLRRRPFVYLNARHSVRVISFARRFATGTCVCDTHTVCLFIR